MATRQDNKRLRSLSHVTVDNPRLRRPVLVMTGDPARAGGMLHRGAVGYLAKPFRVEALNEKLREILS